MLQCNKLRYFKLWSSIGWLLVLIMCYLSLTSTPPELNVEFKHVDKIGHFISYFILMMWFAQLYKTVGIRLIYVVFFITMGAVLEVLQGLGGVRLFEYYDMLANSLGVVFAWFITKKRFNDFFLTLENIASNR